MRRIFVFSCIACWIVSGQEGPAFEVASVKFVPGPIDSPGQVMFLRPDRPVTLAGDRVTAETTLYELIQSAYQLGPHEIVGPSWLRQRRFEVKAVAPPDTTKEAVPAMLRGLLAERFGLKTHYEDRVRPVRALLVAESGHKLIEAEGDPKKKDVKVAGVSMKAARYWAAGIFFAAAIHLDDVAAMLSPEFDEPVINATGLDKLYRIDSTWTPHPRPGIVSGTTGSDSAYPSALLKQLGLRLEKRRLPTKMLIVDHSELLPTAN